MRLINSPALRGTLGVERKTGLGGCSVQDAFADVGSNRRAVLKPVARSAAREPNVGKLRMSVYQEIPVRSILVLTNPELGQRRFAKQRKTLGKERPRLRYALRAQRPVA